MMCLALDKSVRTNNIDIEIALNIVVILALVLEGLIFYDPGVYVVVTVIQIRDSVL